MRIRCSLSALALLAVACQQRATPLADVTVPPARTDAALTSDAAADAGDNDDPPSDAAVLARPVVRAAGTADRWRSVGTLSPIATRDALDAHLNAAAQHNAAENARVALVAQQRAQAQQTPQAQMAANMASLAASAAAAERATQSIAQSAGASARARAAPAPRTPTANSNSITNNQVANVDEGDIVKASGDDLIILRRGHLFRVSTANNNVRRVGHAPAFAPGTRPGDWYDELIVDGDIALVLGYSYESEATEVNRFRLERGGAIRYLDTFYLRTADYYSSENYATRLVNGRFVMYVPMDLRAANEEDGRLRLPELRLGRSGGYRAILDFGSVFSASADPYATTLHAVLQCDVHAARVACTAHGVLGGDSRTFYVSNTAVYVWTMSTEYDRDARAVHRSWVVRMPHAAEQRAGAAQIRGGPADQFAFDERDGALHLLLRDDAQGDGMWNNARSNGGVSAVQIPLARLDGAVMDAPAEAYTSLVGEGRVTGEFKERWVGDFALFSSGGAEMGGFRRRVVERVTRPRLFAYRATDQRLFELRTEQPIERIEPLGQHALVVGNSGDAMVLTPIALDAALPEPYASLRLPGVSQGETRSHGFFFNPSGPRAGVFGIATSAPSGDDDGPGSSDVSFFRVERLALSPIGTVEAHPRRDNRCGTSCYDWYGNTRPIFWGDRVFALMGDEVVEAAIAQSSLTERRRIDYGLGVRGVVEEE